MTRLPPQPDDNLDQAAASILESEVPARSTVRAVNEPGRPMPASRHRWFTCRAAPRRIARWRGSPRRRAAVPLDPDMATFCNWHIRTLHVIADMKGDDSPDRFPSVRDEAPSQRKPSSKCAGPGDLQSLNGQRPTDSLHTKSAGRVWARVPVTLSDCGWSAPAPAGPRGSTTPSDELVRRTELRIRARLPARPNRGTNPRPTVMQPP